MSKWKKSSLSKIISNGQIELGRGNIISKIDIANIPGNYPIYSSSALNNGKFGEYGKYMFDEELVTWSVDGGGYFFFRPKHRYSVTNVSGFLRVKGNDLEPKFLYYLLSEQHKSLTFDYTTKAHPSVIKKLYWIPSISRGHQQKIATILTTIDTAIVKTQELIDKYRNIKTGLMNDLFTRGIGSDGKLRPPRSEAPELYKKTELGWIPKEWGDIDIDGFCADIADCPHSTPNYIDSGYYCIRTADLEPGMLKLENAYLVGEKDYQSRIQRLRPKKNDIIYSREGERLGIAAPVGEETVCLGQRVMILRAQPYYSSQYLLWYMNYQPFYRDITSGLSATTSPHVNVGDIKVRRIPKPGKDEQFEIGRRIQGIQKRIERELKYQSKLQKQKAGLMQDLLTGKVEVTVPDEEVVNA